MIRTSYEVVFVEGIEEDFVNLNFPEEKIISIIEKINQIAIFQRPLILTERVLNTPLRKIPIGDYRIFLYINEEMEMIYCLSIKHHNKCYKRQEIRKVLTILEKIKK